MPRFRLDAQEIEYELLPHPRRRRFMVEVYPGGRVVVRCPAQSTEAQAREFLSRASDWLRAELGGGPARDEQPRRQVRDVSGPIEFVVRRNPRRSRLALHVTPELQVEVRAPQNLGTDEIDDFVLRHAPWVRARMQRVESVAPAAAPLESGRELLVLGEPVRLDVARTSAARGRTVLSDGVLRVEVPQSVAEPALPQAVRGLLHRWLSDEALRIVRERLPLFSKQLGVSPAKVTVKNMKTRWGSCSANGNISISYRLAMAPPEVMDYLIVHELCHMLQPNHSSAYWALVAGIMPSYRAHRAWLREHSLRLSI